MQISIPKINKETIMTLLNQLQYPFASRHLKSKYVHRAVKMLKYGMYTTNMLRYHRQVAVKACNTSMRFNGTFG